MSIGNDTEACFIELKSTVNTYFEEANIILGKIAKSLEKLKETSIKVANAEKAQYDKDEAISNAAKIYLDNVRKLGKEFGESDLSSIGKWVY